MVVRAGPAAGSILCPSLNMHLARGKLLLLVTTRRCWWNALGVSFVCFHDKKHLQTAPVPSPAGISSALSQNDSTNVCCSPPFLVSQVYSEACHSLNL